jgi:hypothetical protein
MNKQLTHFKGIVITLAFFLLGISSGHQPSVNRMIWRHNIGHRWQTQGRSVALKGDCCIRQRGLLHIGYHRMVWKASGHVPWLRRGEWHSGWLGYGTRSFRSRAGINGDGPSDPTWVELSVATEYFGARCKGVARQVNWTSCVGWPKGPLDRWWCHVFCNWGGRGISGSLVWTTGQTTTLGKLTLLQARRPNTESMEIFMV